MLVGGHRSGYMALMRLAALVHAFVGLAMQMVGIQMLVNVFDVLGFHSCSFLGFVWTGHCADRVHGAIDSMRISRILALQLCFQEFGH